MIFVKKGELSKKEKIEVETILNDFADEYRDFYITKNNLRLFLRENSDLLFECIKKGDRIAYSEEDGIILATGWSDKASRKYIKILAKNEESAYKLIKVLLWNINCNLYTKIKKTNPIKEVLEKSNFRFLGDRGSEILLCREYTFKEGTKKCL